VVEKDFLLVAPASCSKQLHGVQGNKSTW